MEALSIEIYKYFNVRLTEEEVVELINNIPEEKDNTILLGIRNTLKAVLLHPSKEDEISRIKDLLKVDKKETKIIKALKSTLN